eukprot:8879596-Pyramimonas_sp.AAC.1
MLTSMFTGARPRTPPGGPAPRSSGPRPRPRTLAAATAADSGWDLCAQKRLRPTSCPSRSPRLRPPPTSWPSSVSGPRPQPRRLAPPRPRSRERHWPGGTPGCSCCEPRARRPAAPPTAST